MPSTLLFQKIEKGGDVLKHINKYLYMSPAVECQSLLSESEQLGERLKSMQDRQLNLEGAYQYMKKESLRELLNSQMLNFAGVVLI